MRRWRQALYYMKLCARANFKRQGKSTTTWAFDTVKCPGRCAFPLSMHDCHPERSEGSQNVHVVVLFPCLCGVFYKRLLISRGRSSYSTREEVAPQLSQVWSAAPVWIMPHTSQ